MKIRKKGMGLEFCCDKMRDNFLFDEEFSIRVISLSKEPAFVLRNHNNNYRVKYCPHCGTRVVSGDIPGELGPTSL